MRKTALFFIVLAATVSLVSCEWIGNLFGSSEPDAPHLRVSDLLIYDDSGLEAREVTTLMKVVLTDDLIVDSQAFPELRVLGTFGEDGGPESVRCLVVKLDRDRLVAVTSDAEGTEYLLHMTDYGREPGGVASSPAVVVGLV